MAKYRNKPIEIEATQWHTGDPMLPGMEIAYAGTPNEVVLLETAATWAVVEDGDWIVTKADGDRFPCQPDVFEKQYDRMATPEEIEEILGSNPYAERPDSE